MVASSARVRPSLTRSSTIVLALDGENPWLHYPDSGGRFLRELMAALGETGDDLEPETLATLAGSAQPAVLERLHPGSWINGVFATWIGHPEKTAAWRLLAEVFSGWPIQVAKTAWIHEPGWTLGSVAGARRPVSVPRVAGTSSGPASASPPSSTRRKSPPARAK